MNTTFNIHRFLNFLRWDFIQNYKSYVTLTLGVCIALIVIYFCYWRMEIYYYSYDPSMYAEWAEVVMTVVVVLYGARVFKQMQRKKGAIVFLMQPASRLEKFIGRTFTVLVMSIGCCLLAVAVADIVFWLISLLRPSTRFSPVFVEMFKVNEYHILFAAFFSTYIVGGTLFVKHPMIITSLINCIVYTVFMYHAIGRRWFFHMRISDETGTAATIILVAICVINLCLAYVLFCRKQIIN